MGQADSLARATLAPGDPVRSRAAIGLAVSLARHGRASDAQPLYRSALAALAERIGDLHPFVQAACAAGRASGLHGGAVCGPG